MYFPQLQFVKSSQTHTHTNTHTHTQKKGGGEDYVYILSVEEVTIIHLILFGVKQVSQDTQVLPFVLALHILGDLKEKEEENLEAWGVVKII